MEAFSPGVGNHSRKEKTGNNPNTERKKQNREFNRVMKVGRNIKKENKGMYALDEIKISYAEIVRVGPIPSSLNEQKSTKDISTGPTSPYSQTYICSKWCRNLNPNERNKDQNNSRAINTQSLISNSKTLNQSPIVNSDNGLGGPYNMRSRIIPNSRIKDKVRVMTRFKPKWIIDLKSENSYIEPKGSKYEKVMTPIKPGNRKVKVKTDHVPMTIENL